LHPGVPFLFGPALYPGSLLVKVFGRLMIVLVASSVPLGAGCGRPETELSFRSDCSWVASGFVERVCAVLRSVSFITEATSAWSTFGLSGKALLMSSGIAVVA